ncbi:MAG: MBL fold metallo-hydrolase [Candidatus Gracilibacteria bacterium]
MKITFCGAAREVTGSRHLLEVNGKKILFDCGMAQGNRKESAEKNRDFKFFDPKEIDTVLLSHAHIDHSGNLPYLVKSGFKGSIYSSFATRDLALYMLADSAAIQEHEEEYLCKKNKACEPALYTTEDAAKTMQHFVGLGYERATTVSDGVVASLYDAGHILGSSQIHLIVNDKEKNARYTIGFTGDLGRKGLPLLRDPQLLPETEYLICESTYGNRFHEAIQTVEQDLAAIINRVAQRGGRVIIPAFALERTQEIVYYLNMLWKRKEIPELPIYVDSPLSGNVTEVFRNHPECMDKETYDEFLKNGENPFGFGRLKYTNSVDESKHLNDLNGPMIIISSSGMCEHGRILHHLKNNIEDPRSAVLLVGYQAANTLGRKLHDGIKNVNIFGEAYDVKAEIITMDAFSAHADRSDLLDYIKRLKGLKKIFLVHGEEGQGLDFAEFLKESGFTNVEVPAPGQTYELPEPNLPVMPIQMDYLDAKPVVDVAPTTAPDQAQAPKEA